MFKKCILNQFLGIFWLWRVSIIYTHNETILKKVEEMFFVLFDQESSSVVGFLPFEYTLQYFWGSVKVQWKQYAFTATSCTLKNM